MKERGMLFSTPMVRALLDGSKTQTRRIVKPQFTSGAVPAEMCAETAEGWQTTGHSGLWWCEAGGCADDAIRCPYGIPGDRLWVRETFGHPWHHAQPRYFYRATDDKDVGWHPDFGGWKPSIHMPRAASRINLEIVSVRVERLQDISEADAIAEGIDRVDNNFGNGPAYRDYRMVAHPYDTAEWFSRPIRSYQTLWGQINGPGSWDANPWVWVVEFQRIAQGK